MSSSRRALLDRALQQNREKGFELLKLNKVHAGLWLDKYITNCRKEDSKKKKEKSERDKSTEEGNTPKMTLVQEVSKIEVPSGYREALKLREAMWLQEMERNQTSLVTIQFDHRVIVGLGQGGVLETGVTLDHTWGTPKIPGSALKGVAAAAAHQLTEDEAWRKGKDHDDKAEAHQVLFGDLKSAGVVTFHDALWVPSNAPHDKPLHADIMTPHHTDYYGEKQAYPTDLDSPNPVPFLTSSGTFMCAVTGPAAWRKVALELLNLGLERLGVGAKTAKGYGHGSIDLTLMEAWFIYFQKREAWRAKQRALIFGEGGAPSLLESLSDLGMRTLKNEHKALWTRFKELSPTESQERRDQTQEASDIAPELVFELLTGEQPDATTWVQRALSALERCYELTPGTLSAHLYVPDEAAAQYHRAQLAFKWRNWSFSKDPLWTPEMTKRCNQFEEEGKGKEPPKWPVKPTLDGPQGGGAGGGATPPSAPVESDNSSSAGSSEQSYSEAERAVIEEYSELQAWADKVSLLQKSHAMAVKGAGSELFHVWWRDESNQARKKEKDFKKWLTKHPIK